MVKVMELYLNLNRLSHIKYLSIKNLHATMTILEFNYKSEYVPQGMIPKDQFPIFIVEIKHN